MMINWISEPGISLKVSQAAIIHMFNFNLSFPIDACYCDITAVEYDLEMVDVCLFSPITVISMGALKPWLHMLSLVRIQHLTAKRFGILVCPRDSVLEQLVNVINLGIWACKLKHQFWSINSRDRMLKTTIEKFFYQFYMLSPVSTNLFTQVPSTPQTNPKGSLNLYKCIKNPVRIQISFLQGLYLKVNLLKVGNVWFIS